jgi:hypothetical protein
MQVLGILNRYSFQHQGPRSDRSSFTSLITDYVKVAREPNNNGLEFDEWDFIIVGGGMIYLFYS